MEESVSLSGGAPVFTDYIVADGQIVAIRKKSPLWGAVSWGGFKWTATPAPVTVLYVVSDHLGSLSALSNASTVVERDSYDAWGRRRNLNGTDAACGSISSVTTRGFTGQEMRTPKPAHR